MLSWPRGILLLCMILESTSGLNGHGKACFISNLMISCSPRSRSAGAAETAFENTRNKRVLIYFARTYIQPSLSLFDTLRRLKDIEEKVVRR